jgi:hypothetical protein
VIERAVDAVLERLEHLFIGANRVIASDIVDTVLRAGLLKLSEGSEEKLAIKIERLVNERDLRCGHCWNPVEMPFITNGRMLLHIDCAKETGVLSSEGSGDGKMRAGWESDLSAIIGKLSAAALQISPNDDQIIADHVRDSVALLLQFRHKYRATPAPSPAGCVSVPREPDHNMIKCAMAAAPAGVTEQQVEAIVRNALASAVGEECLPTDVHLEPGWLARDVARASARVAELEGKSPSAPAPAPDGLVQRFVDALNFCDQPGQQPIQGFHYPPHFVIRNVRLSHGQELWRGPDDNRAAFERQCKIEKFKLIFASAGLLTGSAAEMREREKG